MEYIAPHLRFIKASDELRLSGIILEILPGEYRVNYRDGTEATAYYTDELEDALSTGRVMTDAAPHSAPPLGPTGRRKGGRGWMYRHTAGLAARHRAGGEL